MYAYLFTHLLGGEAHFWDEMVFVSLELEDRISLASRPGNGRRSHRTLKKKKQSSGNFTISTMQFTSVAGKRGGINTLAPPRASSATR